MAPVAASAAAAATVAIVAATVNPSKVTGGDFGC